MNLREVTIRVLMKVDETEKGAAYPHKIEDYLVQVASELNYVIDTTGSVEVIEAKEAYSKGYNNDMLMRYLRVDQDGHRLWDSAEEAMVELYGPDAGDAYWVKDSESTFGMELWATDPENEELPNATWLVRDDEIDRWRKASEEEILIESDVTRTLTNEDDGDDE